MAKFVEQCQGVGINAAGWLTACAETSETVIAEVVEEALGHDAAARITGAQEQNVARWHGYIQPQQEVSFVFSDLKSAASTLPLQTAPSWSAKSLAWMPSAPKASLVPVVWKDSQITPCGS